MKVCSVDECDKESKSTTGKTAGLCNGHAHRVRRYGSPTGQPEPRKLGVCAVDECDGKLAGAGYCRKHYGRYRTYGDPLAGELPKGEAKRFILDLMSQVETDGCIAWPYGKNSNGYGRVNWDGSPTNVHAVVCLLKNGPKPSSDHEACHSCGNGHKGCINPRHISWGTRKQNVADAIAHGTAKFWGVPVSQYSQARSMAAGSGDHRNVKKYLGDPANDNETARAA